TLNDISVAVWRASPDFFGMKGYPYPDNHKVHYILYGSRGLIAKGIILRVREGLFRVSDGAEVEAFLHSAPPAAKCENGADGASRGDADGTGVCCRVHGRDADDDGSAMRAIRHLRGSATARGAVSRRESHRSAADLRGTAGRFPAPRSRRRQTAPMAPPP